MHIDRFIGDMETIAPSDLADDFDVGRIGLVIEGSKEVNTVCCALDATPVVVGRAASMNADMLVVHHTPLWDPVMRIHGRLAGMLREILAKNMNLYVMHTNFDRAAGGINETLALILGLTAIESMSLGVVGTCTLPLDEMVKRIGGGVRVYGQIHRLERLAVTGGSGFDPEYIREAVSCGADAYLSAELKHGVGRSSPIPLIESTHYALEAPGMRMLAERKGWEFIDDPPQMVMMP